jgi:hypothetical protein
MKRILAILLLSLSCAVHAQEHFIDGGTLYDHLVRKDPTAITYIFGVYDAMQIVQYHGGPAGQYFCSPPGVTGQQLADGVRDFLESEPAVREFPAGILVLRAFIDMFPCGKT